MATSGYKSVTTAFGYVRLSWSLESQDISNNTSTISYALTIYRSSSINSTASKDYSIKINGVTVASGTTTIGGSGTKTIKSGTTTISHNSDGTKTFSYSFSQEIAITWSGSYIGTISGSSTGTLTTIPRATTPTLSATSATMGEKITISTPRASSSFTHNLSYKIGSESGTIATNIGTSYSWAIPLSLANGVPSATSGTCTITCKTYNGSTLIGTKTATFKANVPSSVIPSCSVAVSDKNGYYSTFGAFIQNKSKANVVVTASGVYGSTIKSYKSTINGVSYSTASFTSNTLTKSGTIAITTIVTDTRGRTKSVTTNIEVLAYSVPTISSFSCCRADSTGATSDSGTYLKANVNFTIKELNSKNTKTYTLQYKEKDATEWVDVASGSAYSFNDSILSSSAILSTDSSYDVRLVVKDYFATITSLFALSTAFKLIHANASGKGLAIGKKSEKTNALEIALPTYFTQAPIINGGSKILWEGAYYMQASHTIGLKEVITAQANGIVLVFSKFDISNQTPNNYNWNFFFIPKIWVTMFEGVGSQFLLSNDGTFTSIASKYLYIYNDHISGNDNNLAEGTTNGITFKNREFVLRFVLGV